MQINSDTILSEAKWITCPDAFEAPVICRTLTLSSPTEGKIMLSALGYFMLYVNGQRVGNEYFLPSNSLYHERDPESWIYPLQDTFTYRSYYTTYDITGYLREGDNILEIALGNGWYRQTERVAEGNMAFGSRLGAIYAISVTDQDGNHLILSDGSEQCRTSAVTYNQLFYGETYDARIERNQSWTWVSVQTLDLPDTLITPDDAPPDRIIRRITPRQISEQDGRTIYDAGENISGFVILESCAGCGEEVHIRFAENLQEGELSYISTGSHYRGVNGKPQIMEDIFIGDGTPHIFTPQFVWHAFRYFEIIGNGRPVCVAVVHSDTPPAAVFRSSSPELNWLYEAYRRTQLNNMHGGVPSDCPHRERLGYTGDGQICVPAAMIMLDTQAFYRKWIRDIFDSQDTQTGHVNHTAPFAGGGGGPGGWGCAAVLVPYQYYKTYGDREILTTYFDRMLRWIEYLNDHSENGLVIREEEGGWCLGDWCTLEKTMIPVPLVNTCYFIKSLLYLEEIAVAIGRAEDISSLQKYRHAAENGVVSAYYDQISGSFAEGIQGADAFALWAGLGDNRTFTNLVRKYRELGHFDTGFLGTEILCGLLWEKGEADLVYTLLTSHEKGSFGYMMEHQATTIWEDWHGGGSHDHPMFGACAGYLLSAVLGVRQTETSAAYRELLIAPQIPSELSMAEGSINLPIGKVSVRWQREGALVRFTIDLPENISGTFVYDKCRKTLTGGKHDFVL